MNSLVQRALVCLLKTGKKWPREPLKAQEARAFRGQLRRDKEQIVEQTWPRIREGVKPRLRRRVVSLESLGENIEAPRRRK